MLDTVLDKEILKNITYALMENIVHKYVTSNYRYDE